MSFKAKMFINVAILLYLLLLLRIIIEYATIDKRRWASFGIERITIDVLELYKSIFRIPLNVFDNNFKFTLFKLFFFY